MNILAFFGIEREETRDSLIALSLRTEERVQSRRRQGGGIQRLHLVKTF